MMSSDVLLLLGKLLDNKSVFTRGTSPGNLTDVLSSKVEEHLSSLSTSDSHAWVKQELLTYTDISGTCEAVWKYALCCLNCLKCLCKCLIDCQADQQCTSIKQGCSQYDVPPLPPDSLSVAEQQTVQSALQFVVGLSISPYLLPGVGVPLDKRSDYGHLLHEISQPADEHVKSQRLFLSVKTLYECSKTPSLASILFSKHLSDILAGLLQLVYTARRVRCGDFPSEVSAVGTLSRKHVVYCSDAINDLVERAYPALLMRELLVLQGSGPPTEASRTLRHPSSPVGLQRSPVWLRKTTAVLLSQQLMRPDGVMNLVTAMIQGPEQSHDDRVCEAIAKVIAHCPKQSSSVDEYYAIVCPQVLCLLQSDDGQPSPRFLRVASSCILTMLHLNTAAADRFIFGPMLSPLVRCSQVTGPSDEEVVIIEEKELGTCIETIHKMFVCSGEPSSVLVTRLDPVLSTLFNLYMFCKTGVSHLRQLSVDILQRYFQLTDLPQSVHSLQALSRPPHQHIAFKSASSGGVQVVTSNAQSELSWPVIDERCRCVVELLIQVRRDQLAQELFLSVLQDLTKVITTDNSEPSINLSDSSALLDVERRQTEQLSALQWRLSVLSLLSCLIDMLGPDCFTDNAHILAFIKVTLERGVVMSAAPGDDILFENETLSMALGLLTVLISGVIELSAEDRQNTKLLLPLLESLVEKHSDESVQQVAADLHAAIATHGVVWSEKLAKSTPSGRQGGPDSLTKRGIQAAAERAYGGEGIGGAGVCSRCDNESAGQNSKEEVSKVAQQSKSERGHSISGAQSPYAQCMCEIKNVLIPVQGHGLIALRKLIESKDEETMKHVDDVMSVLIESVRHTDSYVYLAGVQALASLAGAVPEKVISVIAGQFQSGGAGMEEMAKGEVRLKMGEVLVKATRALGDITPHYRDLILSTCLRGARDSDPFVRASAVSNMAEVCKLLRFSLSHNIHEVFNCCSSLLKTDKHAEVRQAAAMLITMMLTGLGNDALKVLDAVIRDVYRLLKLVYKAEQDEAVLLNVAMALEELDRIMRELLFPKQTLEKKISVLHP